MMVFAANGSSSVGAVAGSFADQPTPDDRATNFTAVDGTTGEQYSGYKLMVEAYAAIWLVLMVWLALLWRKQAELTARVNGLEAAITRAEKRLGSDAAHKRADATKAAPVDADPETSA